MPRRSTTAILFAVELWLSLPRVAGADDVRERAAAAFDRGVMRFRLGDAEAALVSFQEAYRLVPNPEILYNIGQTELALGDEGAAYGALERYLAESPEVPRARRAEVGRTLRDVRPRIAAVILSVRPANAMLSVDGGRADPLPVGMVLYLGPGQHRLELRADEHSPEERAIEVAAGGELRVDVALAPGAGAEPAGPPAPEGSSPPTAPSTRPTGPARGATSPRRGPPLASYLFGAGAIAAVTVGAVTGVLALSRQSEVDDARAAWSRGEPVDRSSVEDRARAGKTLALVTDIALAVAVAAAGAATIFWLTDGDDRPEPAAQVGVALLPRGFAVAVTGRVP